jgi:hypothetical protein
MDDLSLKGIPPKRSQSWGITNQPPRTPLLGLHRKSPNRRPFHGFGGQDHQEKRHHVLMCDSHYKSRKETPPKLPNGKSKKRLRKSPKRENRKNTKKP